MSEDKLIFTDPKTGEEMESTWLARFGVVLVWALLGGLAFGLLGGLLGRLMMDLVVGLVFGLVVGLIVELKGPRDHRISQWAHDEIARRQHRRRQHILRIQNPTQVPDTALSRAQPPGEPIPIDAALSLADDHDEPNRLVSSTEDTIEAVVDDSA